VHSRQPLLRDPGRRPRGMISQFLERREAVYGFRTYRTGGGFTCPQSPWTIPAPCSLAVRGGALCSRAIHGPPMTAARTGRSPLALHRGERGPLHSSAPGRSQACTRRGARGGGSKSQPAKARVTVSHGHEPVQPAGGRLGQAPRRVLCHARLSRRTGAARRLTQVRTFSGVGGRTDGSGCLRTSLVGESVRREGAQGRPRPLSDRTVPGPGGPNAARA
jgi:hypothetical protein